MTSRQKNLAGATSAQAAKAAPPTLAYATRRGKMYHGLAEDLIDGPSMKHLRGRINLIFTSPPFPLKTKKRYGNMNGAAYLEWMSSFAERFASLLADDGSLVIEIGNAWEPGRPVMSALPLQTLLKVAESGGFHICQQFVCHNPARLPGPAQWVNVERIRVKDSYTHVWWLSRSERPKANNRNVLGEYSAAMKRLLRTGRYNSGRRPSQAVIGETTFLQDNQGAIPSNAVEANASVECESFLTFSNTRSRDPYQTHCRDNDLELHPARMPRELPEFFIRMLTDEGDIVFDPFGGSNTTGAVAEALKRRWIAVDPMEEYVSASRSRFPEAVRLDGPSEEDSP